MLMLVLTETDRLDIFSSGSEETHPWRAVSDFMAAWDRLVGKVLARGADHRLNA